MVLSKRERYIALGTAFAVGILVLDHFVLTPLLRQREELDNQVGVAAKKLAGNRRTIQEARANRPRWREMQQNGLRRRDASEAEGEAMKEIRNWAQQSNLNLTLLKADRSEKEKEFQKSTIRVNGSGRMEQISRFLWYIQTADIPVQFNEFQLNTHKEGADELTLQLALGTIYMLADEPAAERTATAPATREVTR